MSWNKEDESSAESWFLPNVASKNHHMENDTLFFNIEWKMIQTDPFAFPEFGLDM